jgi:hypothetical protein
MALENSAGINVLNHYGPRDVDASKGGQAKSTGQIKRAEWQFDYSDLPTYGSTNLEFAIPANATIVSSKWITGTAWAGGTSLNVGLYQGDGTVIDADGLDAAITPTTAGAVIDGNGALVGATIGANAGELTVAATGTYTAGTATVIVEYHVEV